MSDISDQEFKLGYWLFLHRPQLRRLVIGGLLGVIVIGWGYSLLRLTTYLATSKAYDEMLTTLSQTSVNTADWKARNAPQELAVLRVLAVPFGKTYDLVAQVKNPNLRWSLAAADYRFVVDGADKATGSAFVLPLEEKYFIARNVQLSQLPRELKLVVGNTSWRRIRDFKDFPILNFAVVNQQLDDLAQLSDGREQGTRLRFDLANRSAYSFWQVPVDVLLFSGSQLVAVGVKPVSNVLSSQSQPVEFVWPVSLGAVSNVVVKPEVNVLDPQVFKPL